ncbi:MAG: alpha/beta hydrolase, partial [Candidatus Zixiibacteriota bacterium]
MPENLIITRATAELGGLRLFYLDTTGEKPPILCLHGRWGRSLTWLNFMRHYHDRYRIIAPDQRGHGLSDKPGSGYTPEQMADDAHALLVHLGCESVIVVGHSMGGRIAAFLADRHPEIVKALAILDVSAADPYADDPAAKPVGDEDIGTKDWPTPFPTYQHAADFLKAMFGRFTNVRYFLDSLVETPEGFD